MTEKMLWVRRHLVRAILLTIATLYFLIDLIFYSLLRPLRRRIMGLRLVERLRKRAVGLNRYEALVLLLVPWLILEPIKPIGFLLYARKHHFTATLLLVAGEVVKLTLFEQLFDMTKPKLMTFPWFAWPYGKWQAGMVYLRSLPVWHKMLSLYRTVRSWTLRHRTS